MLDLDRMRIGLDLERIGRFNRSVRDALVRRTFTREEIVYAFRHTRPAMHLAAAFCAKEAARKALDGCVPKLGWKQVSLGHNARGKPVLHVRVPGLKVKVEVSVSHTDDHAVAVVLVGSVRRMRRTGDRKEGKKRR